MKNMVARMDEKRIKANDNKSEAIKNYFSESALDKKRRADMFKKILLGLSIFISSILFFQSGASAFTLSVTGPDGTPVSGFRWMVEEDTTNYAVPGARVSNSTTLDIHNSYSPVTAKGESIFSSVTVNIPNTKRYFVSVLPGSGYSLGGTSVAIGQGAVTVTVQPLPVPTAQISVMAFVDHNPINNVMDLAEEGLGGCKVSIYDNAGQVMQDAFGNMLGTIYWPDGSVKSMGNGIITTLTKQDFDSGNNPHNIKVGEALIKNLAPGKYGVIVTPPGFDDANGVIEWSQTSTIEGTPTIDAWVKANEPRYFVEGFGTGFNHAVFGFVKVSPASSTFKGQTFTTVPWKQNPPTGYTGSIEGTLRYNHFTKPPMTQGFFPGEIVGSGWVGLNDPLAVQGVAPAGLYFARCDANGHFVINGVPPGTYQLVSWDTPLLSLFGFHTVTVPAGPSGTGQAVNLGNVLTFRWFGKLEASVFNDLNGNGFRDLLEPGMSDQNINIRFRDGTIYQAMPTDLEGNSPFEAVFPFFKWLVVEVDFARFKATGLTAIVDVGGEIPPDNGWVMPSRNVLNPQPQVTPPSWPAGTPPSTTPVNNPNTGNNFSRTEVGAVLTQAMHLFLGQTNIIEWGKQNYLPGENGGISGIVFYATTRAENDPRYAVGDAWEPGIPRVQVNLYRDNLNNTNSLPGPDGIIDDLNGDAAVTLSDVDNYPFDWTGSGVKGAEDIDRNANNIFDLGDAIERVVTDSWDDSKPTGSIQEVPVIHGTPIASGADAFGTWNQVRPGIFNGGYAFSTVATGTYIVEAVPPPGYEIVKEEDKNVDYGDSYQPGTLLLPAVCVGDLHLVPAELTLFPGVPAPYAGQMRPLADRKQVVVNDGTNVAADFHFFTEVPKAARAVGFVNNDLAAEFNQASPNFGEKLSPSWLPISFRDWTGKEITRVYTDEFGGYEALLPSTYTVNVPSPSGVSPNMITLVLNDPIRADGTPDPFYDPYYSVTEWTLDFSPGRTTYLDTPIVPVAAFSTTGARLDTEQRDLAPMISAVNGPETGGGPVMLSSRATGRTITITSAGVTQIQNPDYDPTIPGSPFTITRNYGFGNTAGGVTLGGVSLAIQSWTDAQISATLPAGITTGQVMVTRGDNSFKTEVGVTFHILNSLAQVKRVPAQFATIQAAIDAAAAGDLILVAPGTYNENVVMYKPVKLQGAGNGSTKIYGYPNPPERLQLWHDKIISLGGPSAQDFTVANPFMQNEAASITVLGESILTGTLNPGNPFNTLNQAQIDGFTISGSKAGGGIFVVSGANFLTISNNEITNNQGTFAGGIVVGVQGLNACNDNVVIRDNKIHKNGGTQGGGGINLYSCSDNYLVERNLIKGNLSRFNGAGIAHTGICAGENIIRNNRIIFNENFFGGLLANAGDGGGIHISGGLAAGSGSGNVTIDSNLIQGNLAGAGKGGGIAAFAVNGADVQASPNSDASWFRLKILNNIIVNNVAGYTGAGIFLQDVSRAVILHNTIANNDATATSASAFTAGQANSNPQPSGISAGAHSAQLQLLFGAGLAEAYPNPQLANNIIWRNRSWFNNASLNGGAGGLAPNPASPYWDLGILGSVAAADAHFNPLRCVLSSQIDPVTGHNYGVSVSTTDPVFAAGYFNIIESAAVIDEGGNAINVRFSPLTTDGSDYHIGSTSSAIGLAGNEYLQTTQLLKDFDGQARPNSTPDSGADEFSVSGGANSAPVAVNDAYGVEQDSAFSQPTKGVLTNDTDLNADNLIAVLVSNVSNGSLVLNGDGSFTYTPNPGFLGLDSFTYRANDGQLNSNIATVNLQVSAVVPVANQAPAPTAAQIVAPVNGIGYSRVIPNDLNTGDTHAYTITTLPVSGTATVSTAGVVNYTPATGFNGTDSFVVTVTDQGGLSGMVTIPVSIGMYAPTGSGPQIQFPPDTDGIDTDGDGIANNDNVYMHLSAGDGFVKMADGYLQYMFGFGDMTNVMPEMIRMEGMLAGEWPAPTIKVKEGQKLYLHLTNVGMMMRPDLFDPHSVHWHGFPEAASIFDGVPDASISINMGGTLTYFYNIVEPGTYLYHCHVEATEHMQMGMLGNLYVTPKQDGTAIVDPYGSGKVFTKFAYNDVDGSTGYDIDVPLQIGSFDPNFHDASMNVQTLPFALMEDKYGMINGRGYPDTINPLALTPPQENGGKVSQPMSSRISVTQGNRVLLRISNVSVTRFFTLASPSITMRVVGKDARLLRGPTGQSLYYNTNSVTLGGGESIDVILDTAGIPAGTYTLHTTNLHYLSNNAEDFGGIMTEIVIN